MPHIDHREFDRIMPTQDEWDIEIDVDYDDEEYDDDDPIGPERSYFE